MTASTLGVKSVQIANMDASPVVRMSCGAGGPGITHRQMATVTPAATTAHPVYYPMVRIPSNCYVQKVELVSDANSGTTFTGDVTLFYSDNANDGTDANAGVGLVLSNGATPLTGAAAFFAAAEAWGGLTNGVVTDVTFANAAGTAADVYLPSKMIQPIWQAAGLTSDPGGFFDVSFLTTSDNVGAAVKQTMIVSYIANGPG